MSFASEQLSVAVDWFDRLRVTHLNLAALGDSMVGASRARTLDEVWRSVGWASAENAKGAAIYMRPARFLPDGTRAEWPVVFFDDVPDDVVGKITRSAMVIRTSPGRNHVWFETDRPLSEIQRRAVQVALQPKLRSDPASISGEHFGRAPGYKNYKRGSWVSVLKIVSGKPLDTGKVIDLCAIREAREDSVSKRTVRAVESRYSESEREFGYVIGRIRWALRKGQAFLDMEISRLTAELISRASLRGKRNPVYYAELTIRNAMSAFRKGG